MLRLFVILSCVVAVSLGDPVCPPNEVINYCANRICRVQECKQVGKEAPCPDEPCQLGCVCRMSYLRASNGTCIPGRQCTGVCTKPNEYVHGCAFSVSVYQKCEYKGKIVPTICLEKCDPGCVCTNGYLRSRDGICIPEDKCEENDKETPFK